MKPQRKWSVPQLDRFDKLMQGSRVSRMARSEAGFTLIELLVVVVIIGILIAIAIPLYLNYQKSANDKSAQSDVRGAISIIEQCNSESAGYPTSLGTLAANAYPVCTGQSAKVTKNTTLTYAYASATLSYMLTGKNSGGSGKTYCYNSLNGGSVIALSGTATTC